MKNERETPLEKAAVLPVALSPFRSFSVSAAIIGNGNTLIWKDSEMIQPETEQVLTP